MTFEISNSPDILQVLLAGFVSTTTESTIFGLSDLTLPDHQVLATQEKFLEHLVTVL